MKYIRKITPSYFVATILIQNTWVSRLITYEPYLKILFRGYVGKNEFR